jgi:peptide deformylase
MKFKIIAKEQTPEVIQPFTAPEMLITKQKQFLIKFLSFARRQHNCCGLAANQVSLDGERIMERLFAIKFNHVWDIVIDPLILEYIGKPVIKEEGCLTWLGKTILAERYPQIKVRYFNLKGQHIEREISGFEAQIFQHEYKHLMGVAEVFE